LLPPSERARLKGVIVNKFRGDVSLFDDGLEIIARETGLPCLGVVPYFNEARRLPAEDALAVENYTTPQANSSIRMAVPVISRIANFDDLDPLIAERDVAVTFVRAGEAIPGDTDLVILPGSKATIADLAYLRTQGWDIDIAAHLRRGGHVLGLCGGYQMLGSKVRDPHGIEGVPGEAPGLKLLDIETDFSDDKTLSEVSGAELTSGAAVRGYLMHMGRTSGPGCARPMLKLNERHDGAISPDGRIMGCYLHGLFAADEFRHAFLARLKERPVSGLAYESEIDAVLDRLAAHLEAHLDLDALIRLAT
jgi:adenosylcobyric acid synthase